MSAIRIKISSLFFSKTFEGRGSACPLEVTLPFRHSFQSEWSIKLTGTFIWVLQRDINKSEFTKDFARGITFAAVGEGDLYLLQRCLEGKKKYNKRTQKGGQDIVRDFCVGISFDPSPDELSGGVFFPSIPSHLSFLNVLRLSTRRLQR